MRCSKSHVSTVSDSRRIGFVSHIRSVTQSVRTFIWKWSDQIFESRQHRPTCACCFGNDVTVCHCLRQWSGLQIHHLTLGTITLPSRGADGLLQRDCPLLFLHVVFQPALLTAAWFLLSLSDALPSLWTWRHRGVSHCERHKTPFEILYEQPELDWTETSPFLEKRIQIAFPTHCKRRLNTICKKITFHVCFCCQDFPKPIWVTLPQLSVTPMSHGGRAYDDNISCPLPPLLVLEWNLIGQLSDSAAPAAKLQHRETAVWPVGTKSTYETTAQNLLSQWQC